MSKRYCLMDSNDITILEVVIFIIYNCAIFETNINNSTSSMCGITYIIIHTGLLVAKIKSCIPRAL